MLKLLQTKILLAILAVLAAIAGGVAWHIARGRALVKHDAKTREFVRKQHEKNSAYPVNGSDSLKHYLP